MRASPPLLPPWFLDLCVVTISYILLLEKNRIIITGNEVKVNYYQQECLIQQVQEILKCHSGAETASKKWGVGG